MRRISQREAIDYVSARGAPREIVNALGGFTPYDPDPRQPRPGFETGEVFNPRMGTDGGFQLVRPTNWENMNAFSTYPFATDNTKAVTIVPANKKRTALIVQNLTTTGAPFDLWVNFNTDAAIGNGLLLTFGQGLIFDDVCPNNSVSVFFASATPQLGVIMEAAYTQ